MMQVCYMMYFDWVHPYSYVTFRGSAVICNDTEAKQQYWAQGIVYRARLVVTAKIMCDDLCLKGRTAVDSHCSITLSA